MTKVDQMVKIQCFYMESDKTVSAPLSVRYDLYQLCYLNHKIFGISTIEGNSIFITVCSPLNSARRCTKCRRVLIR